MMEIGKIVPAEKRDSKNITNTHKRATLRKPFEYTPGGTKKSRAVLHEVNEIQLISQ